MFAAGLYLLVAGGIAVLVRRTERIPGAVAIAFVILPLFITGKALFTGEVYAPLDLSYAHEPLASVADRAGVANAGDPTPSDVVAQFIPWHAAVRYAISHGELPLWNPFELCGGPLAGAVQSAPWHPIHLLGLLLPLGPALTFIATMLFFVALVSAFLFTRDLVRFDHAALFGATAWMFSRHLVAFAGTAHGLALASMPLVLFAARRVVRAPSLRTGALLCGSLLLLVFAGHPETMLHVVALSIAWFAFELWRARGANLRRACVTGFAAGIAALFIGAISLLPLIDAIPQTEEFRYRANGFAPGATSLVRTLHMIGADLLPMVEGLAGTEVAQHPTSTTHAWLGSAYGGTLLFALAAYALMRCRRRGERFFAALFALGVLAGSGVLGAAMANVPIFSIAVNERMIWSSAFALCVLAALAVDSASRQRFRTRAESLSIVFAITAAMLVTIVFIISPDLVAAGLSATFIRVATARAIIPLLLAAAAVLLIRNSRVAVGMLFVLLIAQRSAETSSLRRAVSVDALNPKFAGLELMHADEPFRVVGQGTLLTPNLATQYGLEDVRGYQAMTLARFNDTFPSWSIKQPVWSNRVDDLSAPMLSLMNVRFALTAAKSVLPEGWVRRGAFDTYDIAENTPASRAKKRRRRWRPRATSAPKRGSKTARAKRARTGRAPCAWSGAERSWS
jgi:hypothetical protein